MNQDIRENEVLGEIEGGLGIVTLNRPVALNALSLPMIRRIVSLLRQWERTSSVKAVLFKGSGDGRAFCAGGDMKAVYHAGMEAMRSLGDFEKPLSFFVEEYGLDRLIFHYKKPTIAFMDGITMGGGYGIAGNCRYRVVTERTVFAMPETRIGFFPDVGSMYHLCRAGRNFGRYIALTGNSVSGADMVASELAEFFIPAAALNSVQEELSAISADEKAAEEIFERFLGEPPKEGSIFARYGVEIEEQFSDPDARLVVSGGRAGFALDAAQAILRGSPISVMVTSSYLKRAENMSFDEVIAMDFALAQRFIKSMDLYEGIRAVLVDKDQTPRWSLSGLEEVSKELVNKYFTSTGYYLGDVQIFEK